MGVQRGHREAENSGEPRAGRISSPGGRRPRTFASPEAMARIDAILKLVKEQGASDLHMTTGSPPMVRINGELTPIPYEPLTREMSELLLFEIMDPAVRARYDQNRDVDFSYEVPGVVRA